MQRKSEIIQKQTNIVLSIGVIMTAFFLIILAFRYSPYLSFGKIDANITSSYGTILGAVLAPLWSIVAVYIYYSTLKVQAEELNHTQKTLFAQNLNILISRVLEIENNLTLKAYKYTFSNKTALLFIYLSLKFCHKIIGNNDISAIKDWNDFQELNNYANTTMTKDDIELEEHEMEIIAKQDFEMYKRIQKQCKFDSYIPFFICLFQLSNESLDWKKTDNSELGRIVKSFNIIEEKYINDVVSYFKSIELCIIYIGKGNLTTLEKRQYALWLKVIMRPTDLILFYYYLCRQYRQKSSMIKLCKELAFFDDIDKKMLFDESHLNFNLISK